MPVLPASGPEGAAAEAALTDVLGLLRARTGHDFRHYKRATVLRRLERRLQVNAVPDLVEYLALLQRKPEETSALLKDMLIGVTNFFRDREAFETLEREVGPALFAGRPPDDQVRAWSVGCASGEEAYSLAILLVDQAARLPQPPGGAGIRHRHRRAVDRHGAGGELPGFDRHRRRAEPAAAVFRPRPQPLPDQQADPRPRAVRAAQRAARPAVLAGRPAAHDRAVARVGVIRRAAYLDCAPPIPSRTCEGRQIKASPTR
jgi:hypothetical protein